MDSPIVIVDDSFSKMKGPPVYDTIFGGTYDITVLGYSVQAASITAKISRKLNTDDIYDFTFLPTQDVPFDFAYLPGALTLIKHGKNNIGWGTLVL